MLFGISDILVFLRGTYTVGAIEVETSLLMNDSSIGCIDKAVLLFVRVGLAFIHRVDLPDLFY